MRDQANQPAYMEFMDNYPSANEWLQRRPKNTQIGYGFALMKFCEFADVTPKDFQLMNRKEARNTAWNYIKTLLDKPSVANVVMAALKSFYRNHDGEILPFDSHRGGKHYFNNLRRKRAAYEHIPSTKEVYEIADVASNLRNRAIVLILFQSGIRVNALCRLTYGMIRRRLREKDVPIRIRITDEIDTKLRGYRIAFYDTFIGKETVDVLKKYCEMKHRNSDDDTPLFLSRYGKPMTPALIWMNFKKTVRKSGLDAKTIWVHSLRKAFKRVIRKADIDDDFKEAIMGHVLPGSRENYFSRTDPREVRENYLKLDFSREGRTGDYGELKKKVGTLEIERGVLENVIRDQQRRIDELRSDLDRYNPKYIEADALLGEMEELRKELEELRRESRQ